MAHLYCGSGLRPAIKRNASRPGSSPGQAWKALLLRPIAAYFRRQFFDSLLSEERRRDWESRRSSVEPKIPQVKRDVFENVPAEHALQPATRAFYGERLETALHRLFHPPPEGMSERVFITERNELSAQVRLRLETPLAEVKNLAIVCGELERKDAEAREINQQLIHLQQNSEALERGNRLRERRGHLVHQRDAGQQRLSRD